jgi:hypothetical protein
MDLRLGRTPVSKLQRRSSHSNFLDHHLAAEKYTAREKIPVKDVEGEPNDL